MGVSEFRPRPCESKAKKKRENDGYKEMYFNNIYGGQNC